MRSGATPSASQRGSAGSRGGAFRESGWSRRPCPRGFPFHLPPPRGERSGQQGGGGSFSSSPLSGPGEGPPVHLIHLGSCSTRGFSTRFSTHGLGKSPPGISVTLPPKPEWRIWPTNSQVKSEQPEGLECMGDSLKNAFWSI